MTRFEKARHIKSDHSLEALLHAALLKAKENGNEACAYALQKLVENPSVNGSLFRQSMQDSSQCITAFTSHECLALLIEMKLTQRQYLKLRKRAYMLTEFFLGKIRIH